MRLPYAWEIADWFHGHIFPLPPHDDIMGHVGSSFEAWDEEREDCHRMGMKWWDEQGRRTRQLYPFRDWLHHDFTYFISRWKRRLIHDPSWWVRHRLPPHRYNILHTGLKPGYYDPCTRFLHAIMEEVCDYVKVTEDVVDRTWQPEKWAPLLAAAEWWPKYKYWTEHEFDDSRWEDAQKAREAGDKEAQHRAYMALNEIEEKWEQEADDHLVAIMKVRRGIWYP
jgi:hypothetical protein